MATDSILSEPIGVIGAGPAGIINAHVLLQDGFTSIHVLTRDASVGGVWARTRVYPGLQINNVRGEYRFSAQEMLPPTEPVTAGARPSGLDMCNYMESYCDRFLKGKVEFIFNTEVLEISRNEIGEWLVRLEDLQTGTKDILKFKRIIVATGGCSEPAIPEYLSKAAALEAQYRGLVIHSSEFGAHLDEILKRVKPHPESHEGSIVVIGGGKSAQGICAKLTQEGRKCSIIFNKGDSFIASKTTLPDFIRRSRLFSIFSPHIHLRTRLERFLHGTALGGKITRFFWDKVAETCLNAFDIPKDSPLRRTHPFFWGVRTNDEGTATPDNYYTLAVKGEIKVVAPAHAVGFAMDGESVLLDTGKTLKADAVILATGYQSSWTKIISEKMADEIGINKHPPYSKATNNWDYSSLHGGPEVHPENERWVTSIYRGIVPAKNILRRDFAVAGTLFTFNFGYTNEVVAHWISSYFQQEPMRLPTSVDEAMAEAERESAWMRRRYPDMLSWVNASYSGSLNFWTWCQAVDDLLEDMRLPIYRSKGNWLTWPFKVVEQKEIASLANERRDRR